MCSSLFTAYLDTIRIKPDVCPIDKSIGIKHFKSSTYECQHGHEWIFTDGCKVIKIREPGIETDTILPSDYMKEWSSIQGNRMDPLNGNTEWFGPGCEGGYGCFRKRRRSAVRGKGRSFDDADLWTPDHGEN